MIGGGAVQVGVCSGSQFKSGSRLGVQGTLPFQSGPTGIKVLTETYMDVALPEKLISKNRQEGEIW